MKTFKTPSHRLAIAAGSALILLAAAATIDAAGAQSAGGASPRPAAVQSDPMNKYEVKNAGAKQAICNDGSPAAFYFQPGKGADQRKWIVFFQGGGGCASDRACAGRWTTDHDLMTSTGQPPQFAGGGILSTAASVNPDFANYAHVLLHYCSSDIYAGDTAHKVGAQVFEFRGHRIVDGVLDDLMDKSVVGASTLKDATEVIIAGSSAGAFGVENNLDRIAARLPWAKVKGIADSDWVPPVNNFTPGGFSTLFYRPEGMAYYNAKPDESCVAANPTHAGDCLLSSFLYPYIATPMFVYADQHDPVLLGTLGITGPPKSAAEKAYVDNFAKAVRDTLAKQVPAAFSPSLHKHTALLNELWQSARIEGQTLQQTVGNWYFGRKGAVKLILQP